MFVCVSDFIYSITVIALLCCVFSGGFSWPSPMAADGVEHKHDRWVGHKSAKPLVIRRNPWCSVMSGRTLRQYYYCCTYVSQYAVSNMQHAKVIFCILIPVAACRGFCSKQAIGQPTQNAGKLTTVAAGNLRAGVGLWEVWRVRFFLLNLFVFDGVVIAWLPWWLWCWWWGRFAVV